MKSLPRHLQQLEAKLAGLAGVDDGPMLLSELDGFIAGILVCPEMIMPNEWLPIVLGDNGEGAGAFETQDAMQDCVQLVFKHYNTVSRDLQRGSGRYTPVFDVDPRHDEILWELWIGGFERAMAMRPESWLVVAQESDDEEAAIAMAGMMALIAIAEREADTDPDPEQITALTEAASDLIPEWVETLNIWRLRNATDQPAPAKSTKVGRNDPCPCGSGKKYKKCCGLN
jgi:uncharacterized protein